MLLHLGQRELAFEELVDPAQPRQAVDGLENLLCVGHVETEV